MKAVNNLPVKSQNKNAVQLHDNGLRAGSLIERSLANLDRQQVQNLMAKAGEEALRLEVKSREQNMDYVAGKKTIEDHIDTFNMLDKSGKTTAHKVISDVKTGAGTTRIESKSGATCFVASVAYDDPNHPDVMFLRWYRDHILNKTQRGQSFIAWYWRNGPNLARLVGKSTLLRKMSRLVIAGIVKALISRTRR